MKEIMHIYTRVSTASQEEEGTSLETQKELGIKSADKKGFDYRIWNEGGQSSSKDDLANRPVLMELLNEIRTEMSNTFMFGIPTDCRGISRHGE